MNTYPELTPELIPVCHCLECGDEIPYGGRKDRKFCSDKCRNDYHNGRRIEMRVLQQRIDTAIHRNYRILARLLEIGITHASWEEISLMGFRREYMTTCRVIRRHMECRCYEYAYRISDARIYDIRKIPAEFLSKEAPPE